MPDIASRQFPRGRRAALVCVYSLCILAGVSLAQSPQFLVASVKPAAPPHDLAELTFQHDPGRVAFTKVNLSTLAVNATGVPRSMISGPEWIDSAWFQFSATMPPNTTDEQLRQMFLHFLEERFAFRYHSESREARGYAVTVAPRGPKLPAARAIVPDQRHQGLSWYFDPPHDDIMTGHLPNCSMRMLADAVNKLINGSASRPGRNVLAVEDRTGLDGHYDITLNIEVDSAGEASFGRVSPAAVRQALEEQLGLTLAPINVAQTTVVIDHVVRTPTPN
jgi:uncharacterized protein (TIGR03435 family)